MQRMQQHPLAKNLLLKLIRFDQNYGKIWAKVIRFRKKIRTPMAGKITLEMVIYFYLNQL